MCRLFMDFIDDPFKSITNLLELIKSKINDAIILIRSLLSRIKRLIELKKLQTQIGSVKDTVNHFRPPIFWQDKQLVEKQVEFWSSKNVYELLNQVENLELNFKRNSDLSNNLIFDLILNISNNQL